MRHRSTRKTLLTTSKRELFVVAVGALIVWCAAELGALSALDDWMYDQVVGVQSHVRSRSHPVFLVYVDRSAAGNDPTHISRIVDQLRTLEARGVGLTMMVPKGTWKSTATFPVVTPGRTVSHQLLHPRRGVHRWHVGLPATAAPNIVCSLESVLAEAVMDRRSVAKGLYRVGFRGGPQCIPFVTGKDVLGGVLVRELVAGKTVLMGWSPDFNEPLLATPTSGETGMSLLEFRGNALETLLLQDAAQIPAWQMRLLLLCCAILIGNVIGRNFRLWWTTIIAVVAFVAYGGVAWFLLLWQQLWIPSAPLAAGFTLAGVLASMVRVRQAHTEMRRSRTSQLGSELALALESDYGWSDVAGFVHQFVDPERMVLLELPAGLAHLRVVHSENCEVDDIHEQRRDIMRAPYHVASERGDLIRLEKRPFFETQNDEAQFLLPFLHGGEVVGFMAISIAKARLAQNIDFERRMSRLTQELGTLIARRQIESTAHLPSALTEETSPNRQESPLAVYDLFGRLEMMNAPMIALCETMGLSVTDRSLFDLVACLLDDRNFDETRRRLGRVIIDGQNVMTQVSLPEFDVSPTLRISPISKPSSAFNVEAICVAVLNPTSLRGIQHSKEELAERMMQPVLRNAARIWSHTKNSLSDIEAEQTSGTHSQSKRDVQDETNPNIVTRTEVFPNPNAEAPSKGNNDQKGQTERSADAIDLLYRTQKRLKEPMSRRAIQLQIRCAETASLVAVQQELLGSVFELVVELLIARTPRGSQITVECEDSEPNLFIRFFNEVTQHNKFRNGMQDQSLAKCQPMARLKVLQNNLAATGSRLQVLSLGDEILVTIELPHHANPISEIVDGPSPFVFEGGPT